MDVLDSRRCAWRIGALATSPARPSRGADDGHLRRTRVLLGPCLRPCPLGTHHSENAIALQTHIR